MGRTDRGPDDALFVDTNVFLRILTNDIPEQADAAEALLVQAVAGEITLTTNAMVVAEIVWVLESHYGLERAAVLERALAVAHTDGLDLPELDIISEALLDYAEFNVDYIDAYNAAWMRRAGVHRVATFDKRHFARLAAVTPVVPGRDT